MTSIECAKALNKAILELDYVQEYKSYEASVKANSQLASLEIQIKAYQKKIVNQKSKQDPEVSKTIEIYKQKREQFENHPLVVNMISLKEEVDYLLQSINQQINIQLLDKDLTK